MTVGDRILPLEWSDGLKGVADVSAILGRANFTKLNEQQRFRDVRIVECGHTIYWLAEDGSEIDICPDVLRAKVDPGVAAWIAEQERLWQGRQAAESFGTQAGKT